MNKTNQIVIGRVVSEPVLTCKDHSVITSFRIVDDNRAEEYVIIAQDKEARICKKYLRNGFLCCVDGKYNTSGDSIIANRVTFMDCNNSHKE